LIFVAKRPAEISIKQSACQALVGAGLGLFLALAVLAGNASIFHTLSSNSSPGLVLIFAGVLSATIAVGSAITGFIFSALERS
jgi:hypothetical protein